MSESTEALPQGGQTVAEGKTEPAQPAPRNDAEAARQESEQRQEPADAAKAEEQRKAEQEGERKRNRTRAYIDRLQTRNAELERIVRESAIARQAEPAAQTKQGAPTLEQYDFDPQAYARAVAAYEVEQALNARDEKSKTQAASEKQHQIANDYMRRAAEFAETHDDFVETVGAIDPSLMPAELTAAIMAHANGPEIAYKLAQDEDALFGLASTRPELIGRALERYAARMSDAQPAVAAEQTAIAPSALAPNQPTKPISQAPAPPPRVGGRSPAETPPEKLTDDQWYSRDRERRRKR